MLLHTSTYTFAVIFHFIYLQMNTINILMYKTFSDVITLQIRYYSINKG